MEMIWGGTSTGKWREKRIKGLVVCERMAAQSTCLAMPWARFSDFQLLERPRHLEVDGDICFHAFVPECVIGSEATGETRTKGPAMG